ncbi:hypothetical protein EI94DRAFT_1614369, partial [Lactarius quietus]
FTINNSTTVQEGKGAFASRDIQRGDLILSEKPIFSIPSLAIERCQYSSIEEAVQNLSPFHVDQFLSLQNSHTECPCYSMHPLVGILSTNSFSLRDDNSDAAICLKASRFNHSCTPNARFSFNSSTEEAQIYALGPIPRGDEIFIVYINGRNLYGAPRESRQDELRKVYHFTCTCSVCSLSKAESKKSDARRIKINEVWEIILKFNPLQGTQVLNDVVEVIHLLKEEGCLEASDDFTIYAGLFCALHSDWISAKYWASLTYHARVVDYGGDSE